MKQSLFLAALLAFAITSCQGDKTPERVEKSSPPNVSSKLIPIPDSCPKDKELYKYVQWNLLKFGKSKTPETLEMMAEITREADLIAGQEISVSDFGSQAVAKLQDELSRKGSKRDSLISDRTAPESDGVEKYAFWWESSKMWTNRREARLVTELQSVIIREPYKAVFHIGKEQNTVSVYTIHVVPTAKNPIREVEALAKSEELNGSGNMILSGDFNLAADATDPLMEKAGFTGHIHEKTSIGNKVKSDGRYLSHQYDNIYTKGNIGVCASGVIDFPTRFFAPVTTENLKAVKKVSDHLPVYIVFYFK